MPGLLAEAWGNAGQMGMGYSRSAVHRDDCIPQPHDGGDPPALDSSLHEVTQAEIKALAKSIKASQTKWRTPRCAPWYQETGTARGCRPRGPWLELGAGRAGWGLWEWEWRGDSWAT